MNEHEPVRRRWIEEDPADPAAQRLAKTLRPTLSAAQLVRVEARLFASLHAVPGTRTRTWLFGAAALTAGLVLFFLWRSVLSPPPPLVASVPSARPHEAARPADVDALAPLGGELDSVRRPPTEPPRAPVPSPAREQSTPRALPRPSTASTDAGVPDPLLRESGLLDGVIERLRRNDAAGAMTALDTYYAHFPHGRQWQEAALLRTNILLALGRTQDALADLDALALAADTPRTIERRLVRGELRAMASRCAEAVADFESVIGQVEGELAERALYGRSLCRVQLGESGRARNDLAEYLRRYPNGRFSSDARRLFLAQTSQEPTAQPSGRLRPAVNPVRRPPAEPSHAPAPSPVRDQRPPSALPNPSTAPSAEPPPPATPTGADDPLLRESGLLGVVSERLRRNDAAGAMTALDAYYAQFPHGNQWKEAALLRTNVLLALGWTQDALADLDAQALVADTPKAIERRVVRAELRARASRCVEAVADFESVAGQVQGELAERVLYGRSSCRMQLGEKGRARNELAEYLRRYPNGRFSADARKLFLAAPESP